MRILGCHRSRGATQFVEGQLWPLRSRLGPPRTSNWKPGHTFTNWREPALPFSIPKGTKAKCQPKALAICCARYRKRLWTKLMVSSLSFKRSAESYRAMAIAFNATNQTRGPEPAGNSTNYNYLGQREKTTGHFGNQLID